MSKISKVFACDNIDEFIKSVNMALPYRGYSESKFFICNIGEIEFLTKLSFYKKTNPEIYSRELADNMVTINPHDAEISILKLLKNKIIDGNISPCILELLYHKKCSNIEDIVDDQAQCDNYITNADNSIENTIRGMFCRHVDLVKSGLAHEKFSFLVLEECDITFNDFIRKYIDGHPIDSSLFTSLMFQLVYTIYAISVIYPDFRHADLHTDNVMLKFDPDYNFDMNAPKFLVFEVDKVKHFVPYFGIIVKIIDFGFASIPEENIRSFASEDRQLMYMRTRHDLLFFLHDVYEIAGNNPTIYNFLTDIEPNETFKHYNTAFIRRNQSNIPSYKQMVNNDVFESYRRTDVLPEHIYHEYVAP